MSWNYMTFHAMQINSSILGNFQIMSNLKIWQDYLHNLESQSFLALALAFHLPNTKSTILSDTKELLRNMLLHLTTLLQSMLMPHTLANNDIQTSTIIHLSLLKIYSKFRINVRFKGKVQTCINFIYTEKATKFCEISILVWFYVVPVKKQSNNTYFDILKFTIHVVFDLNQKHYWLNLRLVKMQTGNQQVGFYHWNSEEKDRWHSFMQLSSRKLPATILMMQEL